MCANKKLSKMSSEKIVNVDASTQAPVKEKKPRSEKQIASFAKARAALALKREATKAAKQQASVA